MIPNTVEAKIWRPLVSRLTWALIASLVIIGALVYTNIRTNTALSQSRAATESANAATLRANHAVSCINTTLGNRSAVTASDNAAHVAFAESLLTVLSTPTTATPAEQKAAVAKFVRGLSTYVTTLVNDQKYRDDHPLGLC